MTERNSRVIRAVLACTAMGLAVAGSQSAIVRGFSTLTITLPQGTTLPAGPDFATDVLKDPWDFKNAEDLSPDPGETPGWCTDVTTPSTPCTGKTKFSVGGGSAGGTAATNDAQLGLLFTGYANIINPGKNGINYPIDTTKFKKLAFRINADVVNTPQVFWFPISWLDPADAQVAPNFDRNFGELSTANTVAGAKTILLDLTQTPLPVGAQTPWTSGPMKGFRIDPNSPASGPNPDGAGHTFTLNWVRLTCADTDTCAAKQTIQWPAGTGTTTIDIYDSTNTTLIVNAGTAGSGVNQLIWNYGVLPPGTYTIRLSRTNGDTGTQAFTVNTPPTITITDPSTTSGDNYPVTVLGHPWDMASAADIVVLGSENITPDPPDFTGGVLTATNTNGDPNITLLHNNNNGGGTKAIDTSKYRYLTYSMWIDGPVDITNGSVARVHWGSGALPNNFTTTKDIIVFSSTSSTAWRTYSLDLATLTNTPIAPQGGLEPSSAGEPWTTNHKTQLRFDPDEFDTNPGDPDPFRAFHIDDIKLTAKPVAFSSYTIHATAADADAGDTPTVTLYRTTDTNGTGKTVIASGLSVAQAGAFSWNTSAVPSGEYYIYAEVTDGKNIVGTYSSAPIVLVGPPKTFGDFNGDTKADIAVFRPSTGQWFINGVTTTTVGGPGDIPVPGNYAGIAASQAAVYRPSTGQWFIQGGAVVQFGRTGDIPVPGDYNGDGVTDLAVYRQTDGVFASWYINGQATRAFGMRGDIPVPADYDGDGITDVAVFRPSTGTWFIQNSSTGAVTTVQWGQAGDIPVPGQYDADGKADVAVYRPSTGVWYGSRTTAGAFSVAWGAPGDVPIALNVDGPSVSDICVFRPSTGQWFCDNLVSSVTSSLQFGQAGDVPAVQRPRLPVAPSADFDGDGKTDLMAYRPSTGQWFTGFSSTGFATSAAPQWGLSGDIPVPGDYDGDHRSDLAVFRPSTAQWLISLSSTGQGITSQWGQNGDVPMPADYDGDGRTDIAVFRPSNATWYILTSSSNFTQSFILQWGLPGDVPFAADVDGDGRADLVVYRPSTGQWFLHLTTTAFGATATKQWGGMAGDVPVLADFDGDGRADLAIYRPSTGQWFILDWITGASPTPVAWGAAGDVPLPFDYDGDGIADAVVFRPSSGFWFIRLSGGGIIQMPWGSASDILVTPGK